MPYVDILKDLFLDQVQMRFVQNFAFSAQAYPGAADPNLNGKPVFVLAVKGSTDPANGNVNGTITYSFLDVSALVDVLSGNDDGESSESAIPEELRDEISSHEEISEMLGEVFTNRS